MKKSDDKDLGFQILDEVVEKKKPHRKVKRESNTTWVIISLIIIIAMIIFIVNLPSIMPLFKTTLSTNSNIIANVNGQEITLDELDAHYNTLPTEVKDYMNKLEYLNESYIPQILLLQAARNENIPNSEIEGFLALYLDQLNISKEDLLLTLENQGKTMNDLYDQIMISIFINKTLSNSIQVTDEEVVAFYQENQDQIGATLADSSQDIKDYLKVQKQKEAIQFYVAELQAQSQITINLEQETSTIPSPTQIITFKDTGDEICTDSEGKPRVTVFSTTWCPHCQWIKDTVDSVLMEYSAQGLINAHHYEVDIKDDTLTPENEGEVPAEELSMFKQYSDGSIPTFVFGCKYIRIGNGYETQRNLAKEDAEFRAVLDALIQ